MVGTHGRPGRPREVAGALWQQGVEIDDCQIQNPAYSFARAKRGEDLGPPLFLFFREVFFSFPSYYRRPVKNHEQEVIPLHDAAIIAAIQGRDQRAIHTVITRYSRFLWTVAGAVLRPAGTPEDVEECVADVFLYLWQHPDRYDPRRGSLKSWLAMVARSQAVDRYRALMKRADLPLEEAALTGCPGAAEALLEAEARASLLDAVDGLEEPGREILVRRYCFGQKPKEIALALDLNVKQVDNHLYRAKRKLRDVLAP